MSVFSFDEAVADTSTTDLGSVITRLESHLGDLSGFVSAVKSKWEGDEMESYGQIQSKWDAAVAKVQEILTSVKSALESTTGSVIEMRGQVRGSLQASSS